MSERKKHTKKARAREKKAYHRRSREEFEEEDEEFEEDEEEEEEEEEEITQNTNPNKNTLTNHPKRPEDPDAAPPRQLRAVGDRRDQVYVRRRPVRSRDERFQHLSHCSSLVVVLRINVWSKVVLDMFINPAL